MRRLRLLGVPKVDRAGESKDLPLDKPASLLYYLARRGDWVSRSELAFLYRPDAPEKVALSNVRLYIHRAKERFWAEGLEVEKFRVRFSVETDIQAFEEALERQAWADALNLYRGPFLEGIALHDVPGYETWLELERQDLSQKWRTAAFQYAHELEEQGDFAGAESWLEQVLNADPLDEECLQALLRILFAIGKRAQALDAYEKFCEELRRELEIEPLETTRALLEILSQSEPEALSFPSPGPKRKHNLPAQTTRFVGRKRELTQLAETLAKADCRLLTLIGLGGVGKTRLALELASGQFDTFPDGIWFVSLAGVGSPDLLVSSIASALEFSFSGPKDPKDQLRNFLREKDLLLLLDNFEHLVEGAVLLEQLLEAAPKLNLLVTSRIALELSGEWLFDLRGLFYPPVDTEEALERFEAVKLFNNRAERLSATFVPEGKTLDAVAELTRKVEGMPLALELAATWTRSLSVPQLLAELSKGMDVLSSQLRDMPERHRNIRSVFDYSWQRLDSKEQETLAKLSVFQGNFTLEAAEKVADAHLALLLSLINRSLVRRTREGRFELHSLIKQYAAQKFSESNRYETLLERHAEHYLGALADKGVIHDVWRLGGVKRVTADFGNIRMAWLTAARRGRWDLLERAGRNWYHYFALSSRFREGQQSFAEALRYASPNEALYGKLQAYLSVFWFYLGDTEQCRSLLAESLKRASTKADKAFIFLMRANLCYVTSDWSEGVDLARDALKLYEALDDSLYQVRALMTMGSNAWALGDYDLSKDCHARAWTLLEQFDIPFFQALVLREMGVVASSVNEFADAKAYLEKSIERFEALDSIYNAASAKSNLGFVLAKLGDYAGQLRIQQDVLDLHKSTENLQGVAFALFRMGEAYLALGKRQRAEDYYKRGLKLALDLGHTSYMAKMLTGFAALCANSNPDEAITLLSFAIQHPALKKSHREQAEEQLSSLKPTKKQLADARAHAKDFDLETLAAQLLAQSGI